MNDIPIVDVSKLINQSLNTTTEDDWQKLAKNISEAFHRIGFVYILNHGVNPSKIESAFKESKKFFEQPLQNKLKYKNQNATKGYHGGYSTNDSEEPTSRFKLQNGNQDGFIFELRESYDFTGKMSLGQEYATDFHSSIMNLQDECRNIVILLLKLIGIGLELKFSDYFLRCSQWISDKSIPSFRTFRSLFYPGIPETIKIPEGKLRVKGHSDFDFITILFQDSIGGLEVQTTDGNWISASPIPGSIIVNIGDILEKWTGGYYPATKHRVIIPNPEIKKRSPRQSMVYFVHTDSNALVSPLKSTILGDYDFNSFKAYEYPKRKLADITSY